MIFPIINSFSIGSIKKGDLTNSQFAKIFLCNEWTLCKCNMCKFWVSLLYFPVVIQKFLNWLLIHVNFRYYQVRMSEKEMTSGTWIFRQILRVWATLKYQINVCSFAISTLNAKYFTFILSLGNQNNLHFQGSYHSFKNHQKSFSDDLVYQILQKLCLCTFIWYVRIVWPRLQTRLFSFCLDWFLICNLPSLISSNYVLVKAYEISFFAKRALSIEKKHLYVKGNFILW